MTDYTDLLSTAHHAVDLARDIMRTMQPGVLTAKGDRDMASEVDYAIEDRVRTFLAEHTPEIGFLGEENGLSGATDGLMWALDPVDGTVNFVHGSPLCAISLGLIAENRSVLGIVDLPFLGNRYSAAEGNGADADGQPIVVSTTRRVSEAVVALGDYAVGKGAVEKNRARFALTQRLAMSVQRVRMHGSAAIDLAWLAAGQVDAVVILANKPWDTAAGVVIAREAGALIADLDGSAHSFESSATIAANPGLLSAILDLAVSR
ncbi:inositol monophosphatase family protein [Amorphoplanes digitatis]|uniref:inositol-phosphate phosphatase n=1 Tax=Actinoplanes digitatis TaxID=1868 RepID=A0A7W7HT31_9ACTN|nr:inositol monophosphatase family protein [Actinoplanes digitatis]MBB4760287.1 myo-inositol-1(or 4)-monophosphatase [Actinoplanes digitatis]BFE68387.1 inositol monophosphatase family protein [Actinoplanes digitatis]GID98140.1 inositol monophosphatase [Actinoplanes digitatis]